MLFTVYLNLDLDRPGQQSGGGLDHGKIQLRRSSGLMKSLDHYNPSEQDNCHYTEK